MHIFIALLTVSAFSSASLAGDVSLQKSSAEIQPIVNDQSAETTWPAQQAILTLHGSAESTPEVNERVVSESNAEEEAKGNCDSLYAHEQFCATHSSIYLDFSTRLAVSQTNETLLFPFHSFL